MKQDTALGILLGWIDGAIENERESCKPGIKTLEAVFCINLAESGWTIQLIEEARKFLVDDRIEELGKEDLEDAIDFLDLIEATMTTEILLGSLIMRNPK